MCNPRLLNKFVRIILSKTRAYDSEAVNRSLNLVTAWFIKIHRNKVLIPPDFDYGFLFKAIKMLLELDHGLGTSKVIWMLF